jgi:hypothetical protein
VVERSSKKWEVEKQVYEDMDELIYRFIEPMTEFGREMQNYRLYRAEGRDSIEQRLRQDRETNPARIPYYVIPSPDQSRRFTIAYWHQKPRFEVPPTHYLPPTPAAPPLLLSTRDAQTILTPLVVVGWWWAGVS